MDLPSSLPKFSFQNALQGNLNGMMVNPAATATAAVNGTIAAIGTLPTNLPEAVSLNSAFGTVSSMTADVTGKVASELESLKTKLPIMSAVSSLQKQGQALAGQMTPVTDCSDLLGQATGFISGVGKTVDDLQAGLTDNLNTMGNKIRSYCSETVGMTNEAALKWFANACPSPTITVPGAPAVPATGTTPAIPAGAATTEPNPLYTAFRTNYSEVLTTLTAGTTAISGAVTTAQTFVTDKFAEAQTAVTAGISMLKDAAFAQFATANVNPCIQKTLNSFMTPPSSLSAVEKKIMSASSAAQSKLTSATEAIPGKGPGVPFSPAKMGLVPANGLAILSEKKEPKSPPAGDGLTTTCPEPFKSQFTTILATALEELNAYQDGPLAVNLAAAKAWKESRNYAAVYKAAYDNLDDEVKQNAYKALRAEFKNSMEWIAYDAAAKNYKAGKARNDEDTATLNQFINGGMPPGQTTVTKYTENYGDFAMSVAFVLTVV